MARFVAIPMEEARVMSLPPRRQTQEMYRGFVRTVGTDPANAGKLELEPGDRSITERARLKSAAKAEGIALNIQRRGADIYFWQRDDDDEPQPVRSKGNKASLRGPEPQPGDNGTRKGGRRSAAQR